MDEANILPEATKAEPTQKSADLEAKTGDQLVVVTVPSLQGDSIEDYGYKLGRHWGIGEKGKNNGVLFIVAPNDRRVRIEVGIPRKQPLVYEVDPTLPYAFAVSRLGGSRTVELVGRPKHLFGALGEAHRIVEEHFIVADVDAERRKRGNLLRERREGLRRIGVP